MILMIKNYHWRLTLIFVVMNFILACQYAYAVVDLYKPTNKLFAFYPQKDKDTVQIQVEGEELFVIPEIHQNFYSKLIKLLDGKLGYGAKYTQYKTDKAWTNQAKSLLVIPFEKVLNTKLTYGYLFWINPENQNMYQTNILYPATAKKQLKNNQLPINLLEQLNTMSSNKAIRIDVIENDWFLLSDIKRYDNSFFYRFKNEEPYMIEKFPEPELQNGNWNQTTNRLYRNVLKELQVENTLYQCQKVWFSYNDSQIKIWQPTSNEFSDIEFPPKISLQATEQFIAALKAIQTTKGNNLPKTIEIKNCDKNKMAEITPDLFEALEKEIQILALSTGGYVICNQDCSQITSYLNGFGGWGSKVQDKQNVNKFMKDVCTDSSSELCENWESKDKLELLKILAVYAVLGRHGSNRLTPLEGQYFPWEDLGIKRSPAWLFMPSVINNDKKD